MKVLQQLIQHFWQRGVLALDQVHYLVESGFIRAGDLEDYEPRPQEENENAVGTGHPPPEIYQPDELERAEEDLSTQRKVRRSGPKVTDLTREELEEQLRGILAGREASLLALVEMVNRRRPCSEPRDAAAGLRRCDEQTFFEVLHDGVRSRPGLLPEVFDSTDLEPFHELAAATARGPVARGFRAILRAAAPEEWASAAWLFQVPEVQMVTNLHEDRHRLLAALVRLYDQHGVVLARCLQRPAKPRPTWKALGYGMSLLYNARAHAVGRTASGYALNKQLGWNDWRGAWTVAMALDAAAVTPFFIHVFGSLQPLHQNEAMDLGSREDVDVYCPPQWKI